MSARRAWLILFIAVLALRLPDIGHPLVDLDEQMYLLVGRRMWDGAIPYVDIWDRKPIGLFLIYAASALIPFDPVGAYQSLALVAVTATAGVLYAFARRFAPPAAALAAALLYCVWIELVGGRGGQSPVFYDLPMAAAALLVWDTIDGRRRAAVPAMLLAGLALQIKPTAGFEGAFLGIALLLTSWRRERRVAAVLRDALLYIAVALAPTLAAWASYAAAGHGEAWWFANVRSIFLRQVAPGEPIADRLVGLALVMTVPALLALRGLAARPVGARLFLGGWLASAAIGWLLVPPWFNHYALPLLLPLAVASAGALDRPLWRGVLAIAGAGWLVLSGYPHRGEAADARRRLAALAQVMRDYGDGGCPFVFQAPPALYTAADACLPSRYPFPPHLVDPAEARAIGVDPLAETRRILAAHPAVIVTGDVAANRARPTVVAVEQAVARAYRPVARDLGVTVYIRRN